MSNVWDESYSESDWQADQDSNNWAGYSSPGNINTTEDLEAYATKLSSSIWTPIADLMPSSTTSGGDSGSFDFGSAYKSFLGAASQGGDLVTATAAVMGKVSGQLKSANNIFSASRNAVTGSVDWVATLTKYAPFAVILVGGVVLFKYARSK